MYTAMNGYGYSVWYVPKRAADLAVLKHRYSIEHTPHVTAATNLRFSQARRLYEHLPRQAYFRPSGDLVRFDSMYEQDPLGAVGWFGTLWEDTTDTGTHPATIVLDHAPHMTVRYIPPDLHEVPTSCASLPPPFYTPLLCVSCIADTQSLDPLAWKIVYSPSN